MSFPGVLRRRMRIECVQTEDHHAAIAQHASGWYRPSGCGADAEVAREKMRIHTHAASVPHSPPSALAERPTNWRPFASCARPLSVARDWPLPSPPIIAGNRVDEGDMMKNGFMLMAEMTPECLMRCSIRGEMSMLKADTAGLKQRKEKKLAWGKREIPLTRASAGRARGDACLRETIREQLH